jgi:hypothetical protein
MNGGLYPAQEIESSYQSLDNTPAPIGHPVDSEGNFASARSEIGIDYFHAGVWNKNVKRKDTRIYVEKHINERIAMQTELGKQLMTRINALLDGEEAKPIHTSVGVFLNAETKKGEMNGKSYEWVAADMEFDHDAILLDEEGAATPKEGVGMMVNEDRKLVVNRYSINQDIEPEQVIEAIKNDEKGVWNKVKDFVLKLAQQGEQLGHGGRDSNQPEGEIMNEEQLRKLLKANGVEVADNATIDQMTDELQKALSVNKESKANSDDSNDDDNSNDVDMVTIVANAVEKAVKPLSDKIDTIQNKQNEDEENERKALMDKLKNEYDDDELKGMSIKTLKKMAGKMKGNTAHSAYQFNSAFQPSEGSNLSKLEMPNVEVK